MRKYNFNLPRIKGLSLICCLLVCCNYVSSANYYWIGGTGNINDLNHWATTSGGTQLHTQFPGPGDNMFFDEYSFAVGDTLFFTDEDFILSCLNFSWQTDVPTVIHFQEYGVFEIYGNILINENLTTSYNPTPNWISTLASFRLLGVENDHIINVNSDLQLFDLEKYGTGRYSVQSDLSLSFFFIYAGHLDMNANDLSCVWVTSDLFGTSNFVGSTIVQRNNELQENFAIGYEFVSQITLTSALYDQSTKIICNSKTSFVSLGYLPGTDTTQFLGLLQIQNEGRVSFSNQVHIQKLEYFGGVRTLGQGTVDTFQIAPGTYQQFEPNMNEEPLKIGHLIAIGECDKPIYMEGSEERYFEYLTSVSDQQLDEVIFYNLPVRTNADFPGNWTATNSFAFGDYNNIELLSNIPGRTLYKVAQSNDWYSLDAWSLSSGGPGGVCPPRPVDRVIIDNNSFGPESEIFTALRDSIYSLPFFCRDLIYEASARPSSLAHTNLRVFGNWQLHPELYYDINETDFFGEDEHFLDARFASLGSHFNFKGAGSYYLRDGFFARYGSKLTMEEGNLASRGKPMRLGGIVLSDFWPQGNVLDLSGSSVELIGSIISGPSINYLLHVSGNLNFQPEGTLILEGTQLIGRADSARLELPNGDLGCSISYPDSAHHAFIYQSPINNNLIPRVRMLDFAGDSYFNGNFETDSLVVRSGTTHAMCRIKTNHSFMALGTACRPIRFIPWRDDTNWPVQKAFTDSVQIRADYLEFDRVRCFPQEVGFAGPNSRVTGPWQGDDTLNWTFAYQPGVEPFSLSPGFLGADTIVCALDDIVPLGADPFLAPPSLDYDYVWSSGSREASYLPVDSGSVELALTFQDKRGHFCTLRDTVNIRVRTLDPQDWFPAYEVADPRCADGEDGSIEVFPSDSLNGFFLGEGWLADAQNRFDSLAEGTYALTVIGPHGCPIVDSVRLVEPEALATNLPPQLSRVFPDPAAHFLTIQGGSRPYEIQWQPMDSLATPTEYGTIASLDQLLSCTDCLTPRFSPDLPTTFLLDITDANGCQLQQSVLVRPEYQRDIYLPNAFSPDLNGVNDLLSLYGVDAAYRIQDFRVFDRWGNLWFERAELLPQDGWNGLGPNGRPAPKDIYLVTAKVVWGDGVSRQVSGEVMLMR